MMYSFEKNYKHLPKLLPLFPLKRVLLLPRAKLPLNLFENRYLHMFDFALSNGRTIGIIQPNEKLKSNKFLSLKFLSKQTNDLENLAFQKYPKLKNLKLFVEKLDKILFTRMSGSGSSIVLYLATKNNAKKAQKILKKKYKNYWCILSKTI